MDKMKRDPNQQRKGRNLVVYYIVLVCVIISIICQLVGFVSPGWYVIKWRSGETAELGIWYTQLCDSTGCNSESSVDNVAYDEPMTKYRVLTTIALAAAITGAGLLIVRVRSRTTNPRSMCFSAGTAAFMCLVSGTLALGASGRYAEITVERADLLRNLFGYDVILTPFALILTGIGGIIACVCFLALLIYSCYDFMTSQPDSQTMYLSYPNVVSQLPATSDHIFVDQQLQNHHVYQQSIPNVYYGQNISPASVSTANTKDVHITTVYNAPRVTTATRPTTSLQRVSASPWAGYHDELLFHPVDNRVPPQALHAGYVKVHKPSIKKQRTSSHVISVKKRDFSL